MDTELLYASAGFVLFVLGLWSLLLHRVLVRKLIALNVMGSGVFHLLIATAGRQGEPADPIPHALVLTGIVVAVSATALALSFGRALRGEGDD